MRLFLLIPIFIICWSCNVKSNKELNKNSINKIIEIPSAEDYKIINSTFVHLVSPVHKGTERKFGYNNFKWDKKTIPDELIANVYFTGYLINVNDIDSFNSISEIDPERLSQLEDLEFRELFRGLISDKRNTIVLEIDKVDNLGFNKVLPAEINKNVKKERGEKVITYSRLVYNKSKTKATFYFQSNCSGMCGYATFVFVEKINGVWTIKDEILDWVS